MIFSGVYLLVRCLLGCLMVLARREVSKDAELLVLRHESKRDLRKIIGTLRRELLEPAKDKTDSSCPGKAPHPGTPGCPGWTRF